MSTPSEQNPENVTSTTRELLPQSVTVGSLTTVYRDETDYWFTTRSSRPTRHRAYSLNATDFGIPLAITVLVCMILCMVVAYTKARRRRQRQAEGPVASLRSISGGVAMNVNAYRNYGYHLQQHGRGQGPGHGYGTVPPGGAPGPFYPEQPPSYDEAILSPVNPSYPTSQQQPYGGLRQLPPSPPAYTIAAPPGGVPQSSAAPPEALTPAVENVAPPDGHYQQQSNLLRETPTGEPPGGNHEQRQRLTEADDRNDKRKKTRNADDREIEQGPKPDGEGASNSRQSSDSSDAVSRISSSRCQVADIDANNTEAEVHNSMTTNTTTRSIAL